LNKNRTEKRKPTYERKKSRIGFFFVLPWFFGTVFFFLRPLVESILYSFGEYEVTDSGYTVSVTGFSHYITMFTKDPDYIRNITSSMKNMALQVPVVLIFSLFIAVVLNKKFIGNTAAKAVFFLPIIVANGAILGIINGDVFAQGISEAGKVSHMFKSEFLSTLLLESGTNQELVNIATGMVDSVFSLIWKSGIQILIFTAGLKTISDSMYEVAKIEGATAWEVFWKVTFPMVSPMIFVNLIYTMVDNFVDFTNPVITQINRMSRMMLVEQSSAMAWFYFLVVMVAIGLIYAVINRRIYYHI